MRKRVFGRKLKRTTNQRKALFRSLAYSLVLHGRIQTTEAKAKAVKGAVEKAITAAKNNTNALPYLQKHVHVTTAERIVEIAPIFKDRPGGYTRIIRTGGRKKDNAPMVILEFVEKITPPNLSKKRNSGKIESKVVKKVAKPSKIPVKKPVAKKKVT